MGQGGYIVIDNQTNFCWMRTHQHSYQMVSWNFPMQIPPKCVVREYVEWDQGLFHNHSDDAGDVDFRFGGKMLRVMARGGPFRLEALYHREGESEGSLFQLGWEENGEVRLVLADPYSQHHYKGVSVRQLCVPKLLILQV